MSDSELAECARSYLAARLAMGEGKEDWLPMICRVDLAWAALVDAYDQEQM